VPVPGGLEIKPGQTVELKPNSFHLMLENLKEPIQQGMPFKATLTFEKAGSHPRLRAPRADLPGD
jgi:periplasmic copper chaperone A